MTRLLALFLLASACHSSAEAGQVIPVASGNGSPVDGVALPFTYDGPAPPVLPATMVRDAEGRTTVRAIRVSTPLRIDGQLDEALYGSVMPISGFIQAEPVPGAAATENTEVWIAFDDDNVYVGVRASETRPERMIANEMRRDSFNIYQNESFGVAFDTFYDRRNSVNFYFNAIGGRADGQVTNEGNWNADWNPVWAFAVRRTDDGWAGEAAIPFKSIRYRPGRQQIWGVQLRRVNRWKNEMSYLTRPPDGLGLSGMFRLSSAATVVGIEAPAVARALDIKPYVTSGLSTDVTTTPRIRNDVTKDVGVDAKYAVTQGLTADVTVNTDFAQVEADEQQVNLTRFSLFFPEKRDFFLENRELFSFAGISTAGSFGDAPILFYSRRIGLDGGRLVPIDAGGRLTGRSGRYSLGLMNIQSREVDAAAVPATNFSVARIKRDILRRSAVGLLYTRRSTTLDRAGAGETYGVDGTFAFFNYLTMNTYWARTRTPRMTNDDTSYRTHMIYNGDRYGMELNHLLVGANFNPEIGFARRRDVRRTYGSVRFSPRPRNMPRVRKFVYQGSLAYVENGAGQLDTREARAEFRTEFQNSDILEISYIDAYELLVAPFRIARDVTIPRGGYGQGAFRGEFTLGQQRVASGTIFGEHGSFYDGDRTAFGYSGARVKLNPHLAVEPGVSINRITLPFGSFTTKLVSSRVTYTVTAMMFVGGLLQYNSSNGSFSTNLRLRWEYRPGSELFLVYNEGRDTLQTGFPDLQTRAFIVKVNRLVRF